MVNEFQDIEWYNERIEYISSFMLEERAEGLKKTLSQRTKYMTICTENMFHPQNASAIMRNCEAFGIQQIHTVETLCTFKPNVQIVKGTDKWVDIRRHESTADAIKVLKNEGYRIVATTPHTDDTTPESFDVAAGPFVLFFGTEHAGVSQEVVENADAFLKIPMYGFVESLNVSASAAILLYILSERLRKEETVDWNLSEIEKAEILLRWMKTSVRDSERIIKKRFL